MRYQVETNDDRISVLVFPDKESAEHVARLLTELDALNGLDTQYKAVPERSKIRIH